MKPVLYKMFTITFTFRHDLKIVQSFYTIIKQINKTKISSVDFEFVSEFFLI